MKISTKEVFKESWKQVKSNYKFIIPLFLLVLVVSLLLNLEGDDIFSISGIISLLVSPVLYYVVTRTSFKISRNEKVGWGDIFKGLTQKIYLSFLAVNVLMSLAMMVLVALGTFVVTTNPFIGLIFSLTLFAFVFIYFIGVIFFAQYRLIDVGSDFWTAIKDSFGLGQGNRALLVKFAIIAFLLNFVGALLIGVGLLITLPLSSIALAHIYDKLKIKS